MSANLALIDGAVTGFVSTVGAAAGRLSGALVAPATIALTAYILWMGFQIIYGRMESPIATLVLRALRISIIVAFALGAGVYMTTVYGSIQGAETLVVSALAPGATDVPTALGQSISDIFDLVRRVEAQRTPADTGSWVNFEMPDFPLLIFIFFVFLGQIFVVVCGFVPYVLAKLTLMLLVMLGPLFIICLIWPATHRFFESWVSAVIAALLTFAIIAALVGFIAPLIQTILNDPDNDANNLWALLLVIAPCQLIFSYLLWTSGSLAGQLAGGGGSGNPLTGLVSTAMHHGMRRVFGDRGAGRTGGSMGGSPQNTGGGGQGGSGGGGQPRR